SRTPGETSADGSSTRSRSSPATSCLRSRCRRLTSRLSSTIWRASSEGLSVATTVADRLEERWEEKPGLGSWLDTVDHKRIGIRYVYTAFAFFLAGGLEATIIRAQLARPEQTLVRPEAYNQLFTMHGITMIFFFVTPMLFGFGNYFVTLMIGGRDMAFLRLNAFGFLVLFVAGLFVYA